MKAHRFISIGLALALCLTGCSSKESGNPSVQSNESSKKTAAISDGKIDLSETVSITAMARFRPQHADFTDMPIIDELNEVANVEVSWELVPDSSLEEKRSLALSTGDIPDVMFDMGLSDSDIQSSGNAFLSMEEYADYMPNTLAIYKERPDIESFMKLNDGKAYSLPYWHEKPYEGLYNDLYINQDWLDALGLEVPNTIDEFEAMLVAFKTRDPNGNGEADEIPFTFILNHNYFGLYGMYGAFGSVDQENRLDIDMLPL